MTEAKRATRASALAFGIGLGVAVATSPGIASAEVSGTDGSSPSGSTSTSDPGSAASTSSNSDASDPSTDAAAGASESEPDDDGADSSAGDPPDEDDSRTAGDASSESGEPTDTDEEAAEEPTDEEPDTDEPATEEPVTEDPAPQAPAGQEPTAAPESGSGRDDAATGQNQQSDESTTTSPTDAIADTTPGSGVSDARDADADAADEEAAQQVSVTDPTATPTAATEIAAETATQTTTTLQPAAAAPVSVVTQAFVAVADLVVGIATALLSPFAAMGPNGPSGPAASLLELIYVARSRLQDTFFNSSPTVQPMQIAQTGQQVTGTLNAYDADFDRLVYTVTQAPTHGTVVINDDGTFTYTPDEVLGAAGGVDTFEITATEADEFHLHGLRSVLTLGGLLDGVFGLPSAHSASSTVAVAVSPIDGTGTIMVGANPQGVALNADGTRVYVTNSGGNSISVIDTATNTVIHTIENVGNYPTGVVVGATSAYVANMFDNTVSVINTVSNTVTATIDVGDTPQGISLSADGTRLYVTNTNGNTVSVINTITNTVAATVAVGAAPQQVTLSPDGTRAYVTNFDDGTVSVVNTLTNAVVGTITVGDTPQAVAISPDGTRLYVTGYDRGNVSVIDTITDDVVATIPVGLFPDAIAVSADGTRAYVTNGDAGSVSVIDTITNAVIGAIPLSDTGSAIAVSADGTRLYIPNFDAGTLTVTGVNLGATPPGRSLGSESNVHTFWVHNLTDEPVTFLGYSYHHDLYAGPARGTVFGVGESAGFTFKGGGYGSAVFSTPSAENNPFFTADFNNPLLPVGNPSSSCSGGGAGGCITYTQWDSAIVPLGDNLTVTGEQAKLQTAILNTLCRDISRCSFVATREELTSTPEAYLGNVVQNYLPTSISETVGGTTTFSESSSVSVTAKVGVNIKGIVNASISTTYGHSWTESHAFSQFVTPTIPRVSQVGLTVSQPLYRVYGDFTIKLDGVTFYLRDAVFDTPNLSLPTVTAVKCTSLGEGSPCSAG